MNEPLIRVVPTATAREFVDYLMPTNNRWQESTWIFRGHSSSDFELLPTLERKDPKTGQFAWEPYLPGSMCQNLEDAFAGKGQYVPYAVFAEIWLTIQFTCFADRTGLPLPSSAHFHRDAVTPIGHDDAAFHRTLDLDQAGSKDRLPFTALAQHSGLPTRLLDWSRSALAAAYFAVNKKLSATNGEVCVWAFNAHLVHDLEGVDIVGLPSQANPNMLHQSGVFTRVSYDLIQAADDAEMCRLDNAVRTHFSGYLGEKPAFMKVTPHAWALLHLLQVGASQLFPGHAGAAQQLREWAEAAPVVGVNIPDPIW